MKAELLVTSANGVYIPSIFCNDYSIPENFKNYNFLKEDLEYVANEENIYKEDYLDRWCNIENNAVLIADGTECYLCFYEDLWAIPCGHDIEEYFE